MPGVPGAGGPPPKRSTQRRRKNKTKPPDQAVSDGTIYGEPLEGEHSAQARRFWEALRASGQAQFYEASDWAAAGLLVVAIDTFVARPSAVMLASIQSGMASLLVTEGDRRRARLELEKPKPPGEEETPPGVTELDGYRARLAGRSA